MGHRPVSNTIAILHRTLEEIERDLDPVPDSMALGELKRIVLNRIAELELESALGEQGPGPLMHKAITEASAAQPAAPTLRQAPESLKKP